MKKTPLLFAFVVVVVLLPSPDATAQSASKQPTGRNATSTKLSAPLATVPVAHQSLSHFMRDAALLYVETIERAVEPSEIRAELSDADFGIVKQIADRIEIHAEGIADKDFYTFGLTTLNDLASLSATYYKSILIFGRTEDPAAQEKATQEQKKSSDKWKEILPRYIRCDSELRKIIKSGEYADFNALRTACSLEPTIDKTPEKSSSEGLK